MKTTAILGIVLAIIGVIALAYQGFTYTTREKAVDLGSVEITIEEKQHRLPPAPIIGVVAIVGGVILILVGIKSAAS